MRDWLQKAFAVWVRFGYEGWLFEFLLNEVIVFEAFYSIFPEKHLNFLSILHFLSKDELTL